MEIKAMRYTKRRARVVSTPVSYFGGVEFDSQPRYKQPWFRSSVVVLSPCEVSYCSIGHGRILRNSPFTAFIQTGAF